MITEKSLTGDISRKDALRESLLRVREITLNLMLQVPDDFLKVRVHDFYSPIGWHFGHIGMTEESWTVQTAMHLPPLNDKYSFLFANLPENDKDNRVHIPDRAEIAEYLSKTRSYVLQALEHANFSDSNPLLNDGYAWEFAIQHEYQHQETIVELLQLIQKAQYHRNASQESMADYDLGIGTTESEMLSLPGGTFTMGSDDPFGYDNEKRAHPVTIEPFELDKTPVTAGQWMQFITDDGYLRPDLWTPDGWEWRSRNEVLAPEYWQPTRGKINYHYFGPRGIRIVHPNEPVSSISWYEADAYAKWIGKRLPTEAEWEYAAAFDPANQESQLFPWGNTTTGKNGFPGLQRSEPNPVGSGSGNSALGLQDMAGGVWEWTASPFLPYPGFEAFPYDGYSKDHMDGKHFVCRGGSWATSEPILRCAFRNWYVPTYRQGILGLRCAR